MERGYVCGRKNGSNVSGEKGRIRIGASGITIKILMDVAFGAQMAKGWPNGAKPGDDDQAGYLRTVFARWSTACSRVPPAFTDYHQWRETDAGARSP
ncbi:hypothetical protein [Agrobacterium sp.]|uniref:hypothetical protein n=1 Tax=Agrobacterium sp. TaxID=361 RepID=UPI0028A93D67|nr:hypothetical protein [Agrobacterium sp.]